jgi:hypothetical protein
VIKAMNIAFDSHDFPNPHLQNFYSSLHSYALNRASLSVTDLIVPNAEEEGWKRAEEKVNAFKAV